MNMGENNITGEIDTVQLTETADDGALKGTVLPPQAILTMRDNLINEAGRTIPFIVIREGVWYAFINSTSYVTVDSEAEARAAIQPA